MSKSGPGAPAIVWFRQDLRLADNPALAAAIASHRPVLALYVLDEASPPEWRPGGASRWWLHHSLSSLAADLSKLGVALVLRRGDARKVVPAVAKAAGAGLVVWNRCYEPYAIERDSNLKIDLQDIHIKAQSFCGSLLN